MHFWRSNRRRGGCRPTNETSRLGLRYLRSNQQVVVRKGPYIEIAPVNPGVVYVPYYDPGIVYVPPRPESLPAMSFISALA